MTDSTDPAEMTDDVLRRWAEGEDPQRYTVAYVTRLEKRLADLEEAAEGLRWALQVSLHD